jgi:hypothetical protein
MIIKGFLHIGRQPTTKKEKNKTNLKCIMLKLNFLPSKKTMESPHLK